jgi:hypothetical protein
MPACSQTAHTAYLLLILIIESYHNETFLMYGNLIAETLSISTKAFHKSL